MPADVLGSVRYLFLVLTFLASALAVFQLSFVGVADPLSRLLGFASVPALLALWIRGYRTGTFPYYLPVLEGLGLVLLGRGVLVPLDIRGFYLAALFFRAQYLPISRTSLLAVEYYVALLVAEALPGHPPSVTVLTSASLALLPGLLVAGGSMSLLGTTLQREQAARAEAKASELKAERALLEARRLATESEERLRREIAELLHSTVQSKLVVLSHRLRECLNLMDKSPEAVKSVLATIGEELDSLGEHEIRRASRLLHPAMIEIGLGPAVRSLATRFEQHFDVSVCVDAAVQQLDGVTNNRIPEAVRLAAYRSLEEALANVSRHARAKSVEVRLQIEPDGRLGITVSDDGQGFEMTNFTPGLGLSVIAGRVSEIGGAWHLDSAPGEGTTVRMVFPLWVPERTEAAPVPGRQP